MIVKHLWHVATNKISLRVKWVNVIKLKGKSIWVVNEEACDIWGWKNILRIRDEVRQYLVKKIGDGGNTSVIYDNWSRVGVLQFFIIHRDLYNVTWKDDIVVKDIVMNGVCQWPAQWIEKDLYNVRWKDDIVVKDIVMNGVCQWPAQWIEKYGFTSTSEEFWRIAMTKMGVKYAQMDWNDIVNHIASMYCGNSIDSVIRRLGLAACVYVYLIWQERNFRIFRDEKRSSKELVEVFSELIRMRLLSLKVKKSNVVLRVQKKWNVSLNTLCGVTTYSFPISCPAWPWEGVGKICWNDKRSNSGGCTIRNGYPLCRV
nr:reverse transcriptase zinc-binding domain-containing protein [Tanacetum cinerariifolium]